MTGIGQSPLADPCVFVIFGGNGDLTRRLLFPALVELAQQKRLPDEFSLIGFARSSFTKEEYFELLWKGNEQHNELRGWFFERTYYLSGDMKQETAFLNLRELLGPIFKIREGCKNILFYCATSPELFAEAAEGISRAGLADEADGWRRFVVEKPFGRDLLSARDLDGRLKKIFHEEQIYRIDHYLGKETVQNILAFRLANSIFEPLWNRRYIDSIQISATETLGVETRAEYYDRAGALRDMVPNHLFQLLTLIAMEPPVSFSPEDVRDRKVDVLKTVVPLTKATVGVDVVRAQYGSGVKGSSPEIVGYREERGIAKASETETFVALKLNIDNWRWSGVPFYLRTGKRLAERATEIHIQFKRPPIQLFRSAQVSSISPNVLTFKIQPQEKIILHLGTKAPGLDMKIEGTSLELDYQKRFGKPTNTGYETLLFDVMTGDATLFQRADQIEQGWRIVQPILDSWAGDSQNSIIQSYEPSSWGPKAATDLLARDGRDWLKCDR